MESGIIKLLIGIRSVCLGLLISAVAIGSTGVVVEAALLDGVMGGFEKSGFPRPNWDNGCTYSQ